MVVRLPQLPGLCHAQGDTQQLHSTFPPREAGQAREDILNAVTTIGQGDTKPSAFPKSRRLMLRLVTHTPTDLLRMALQAPRLGWSVGTSLWPGSR